MPLTLKIGLHRIGEILRGWKLLPAACLVAVSFTLCFAAEDETVQRGTESRIVGGTSAVPGAYPWMVALLQRDREPFEGHFCGGTLISPRWVLTAGHCVREENANTLDALVGAYSLRPASGERLRVTQIILHPDFNSDSGEADLALLRLERSSRFAPISAVGGSTVAASMAVILGWGADQEFRSSYPKELVEAQVPIVSNEVCNEPTAYNGEVTPSMICAGFSEGGVDSCFGDSGGPLVTWDESNLPRVTGVTSWGEGCARPGKYGVYTRVAAYEDWIERTIRRRDRAGDHFLSEVLLPAYLPPYCDFVGVAALNPLAIRQQLELDFATPADDTFAAASWSHELPSGGQMSFLLPSQFENREDVTVRLRGRQGLVQGLLLLGSEDLSHLDGLSTLDRAYETQYLLSPAALQPEATLLLVNADWEQSVTGELESFSDTGESLGVRSFHLQPGGTSVWSLPQVLGNKYSTWGYSEVRADSAVRAQLVSSDESTLTVSSGQQALRVAELISPHFFVDFFGGRSLLRLLNLEPYPIEVFVDLLSNRGELSSTASVTIPAQSAWTGDLLQEASSPADFLGVYSGYIRVRSKGKAVRLLGATLYEGQDGESRTVSSMQRSPRSQGVLPHLVHSRDVGMYTGIAIVNPNREEATVQLEVFHASGRSLEETEFILAPGSRLVDLLDGRRLFGRGFSQEGGHLEMRSDRPVYILTLLGDFAGQYLSSLDWLDRVREPDGTSVH